MDDDTASATAAGYAESGTLAPVELPGGRAMPPGSYPGRSIAHILEIVVEGDFPVDAAFDISGRCALEEV